MEIKTKFNLKDKLYVIDKYYDGWQVNFCEITVFAIVIKHDGVYYKALIFSTEHKEQDCFKNREEAQAECNRRNNENKI